MMNIKELYENPDTGKVSVSRLACTTAHFQAALWFAFLSYKHGFLPELWIVYLGFATGHNIAGKAVAAYRSKSNVSDKP